MHRYDAAAACGDCGEWGAALASRYDRQRMVGQGAMGTAWLVSRRSDGAPFIAKEVSTELLSDAERDAARNEVRLLSKMEHPHVVRYTDHHEDDLRLVIITEYCEGGDLERVLEAAGGEGLEEDRALAISSQVCLALDHLHSHNVLHRDLKAANVFLTSGGTAKLGDFGIAKSLQHTGAHAITLCGTPFYFSPELCNGEPYGPKSDMWALGVLMYQLLSGRKPFEAANILALVNLILSDDPPPLPRRCSRQAQELARWLLSKDAARRPAARPVLDHPLLAAPPRAPLADHSPNVGAARERAKPGARPAARDRDDLARQQWLENRRAAAANKRRCQQQAGILPATPPAPAAPACPRSPAPPPPRPRSRDRDDGGRGDGGGGGVPVVAPVVVERTATPLAGRRPRADPPAAAAPAPSEAPEAAAVLAEQPALVPQQRDPSAAERVEYQRELRREALRNRQRFQAACLEMEMEAADGAAQAPVVVNVLLSPPAAAAAPPVAEAEPGGAPRAPSPAAPSPPAPPPGAQGRGEVGEEVFGALVESGSAGESGGGRGDAPSAPPPGTTPTAPPKGREGWEGRPPTATTTADVSGASSWGALCDTEVARWLLAHGITAPGGGAPAFATALAADGVHTVADLRALAEHDAEFRALVGGWGYRRRIHDALGAPGDAGGGSADELLPGGTPPRRAADSPPPTLRSDGALIPAAPRAAPGAGSGCCTVM